MIQISDFDGIDVSVLDADRKRGKRGYIFTAEIDPFGYLVVLKWRESGRKQRMLANVLLKLFGENKLGYTCEADAWLDLSVESQAAFEAVYPNVDTTKWTTKSE